MQRYRHDGVEAVSGVEDPEHERRGQPLDDPDVAPVLEGVDDLFSDARVPQGRLVISKPKSTPLHSSQT